MPVTTFAKVVGGALVVVAVAAVVFAVMSGCEKAPAPKGPTPVAAKPTTAAPGAAAATAPVASSSAAAASAPVAPAANAAAAAAATQAGGYPVSGPDGDQTKIEVGGLTMPKPVTWVWTAPSMQFRALQYAVPALGVNAPAAELVFSVFLAGDGGPVDANLDRWSNQFRAGNAAAESKRAQSTVNGMQVSRVESVGDYMGMGAAAPRPGYMQLGAIVQAPGRTVFMKVVGPQATVESNRAAFDAMIAGIR
jgi:pyruvate/2-oxoglutarate dehydrogenase complex dihydrolipoamide acyltransferase (E2) component